MKQFFEALLEIAILFIVGVCFVWVCSIIIKANSVSQAVQDNLILDIHDRENGICSDMYAEGYEWGIGQIPLQVSIWRMEGKSEASIKELLYDMLNNWEYKN